jgi:trigger factor
MSTGELEPESAVETSDTTAAPEAEPSQPKLDLDVQISEIGPCKRHLKIAIARADVDRQFDESLGNLRREAAIPGFRPGRAPKQLVQRRFRKEVAGQVKQALLAASLEQLDEHYKVKLLNPPDIDLDAIELPEDGPMRFEMDVEVEPEFALPAYKDLKVKRPVKTITETDIDARLQTFLETYAQLVPKLEGGAAIGDFVIADVTLHYEGVTINQLKEMQCRLQPELRFQDAHIPNFAEAMLGARPGEVRDAEMLVARNSTDPALRGKTIRATFHVLDLKRLRLPEVDAPFLASIGFDRLEELREALREQLERQFAYRQREAIRRQIVDTLLARTTIELPEELVTRQERSTLQSRMLQLQQAGISPAQLRAREAELRANAHEETLRSLREYFLLSKIAAAEGIKVEPEDVDNEIEAIAARTDESPRRVRARIEKEGMAESLGMQILERKTIDHLLAYVAFEDVPLDVEERAVETLDQTASAVPPESEEAAPEFEPAAAERAAAEEPGGPAE